MRRTAAVLRSCRRRWPHGRGTATVRTVEPCRPPRTPSGLQRKTHPFRQWAPVRSIWRAATILGTRLALDGPLARRNGTPGLAEHDRHAAFRSRARTPATANGLRRQSACRTALSLERFADGGASHSQREPESGTTLRRARRRRHPARPHRPLHHRDSLVPPSPRTASTDGRSAANAGYGAPRSVSRTRGPRAVARAAPCST